MHKYTELFLYLCYEKRNKTASESRLELNHLRSWYNYAVIEKEKIANFEKYVKRFKKIRKIIN